jgi:hypothetical protein
MMAVALRRRATTPFASGPRAAAPTPPTRQYSFTDWQVNNPTSPPPGDRLDAEYDRANSAISETIDWAGTSLNTDGTLRDAIVGENNLVAGLFDQIGSDAAAEIQPLVDEAQAFADAAAASAGTAADAATTAANQAIAAAGAAGTASAAAISANSASFQAQDSQSAAEAAATSAQNADNHATGEAAFCAEYGVLTQAWAEHMPDPIPPNILATMGVTGDHWSARWWANQAAQAFGSFATLYLGAWPEPPTTSITGGAIPIGAIYYNTALEQVFVWNGQEWVPFYAPTKAVTLSLIYRTTAGQTAIDLTVPDLIGNTWSITAADPEPLEVYANGVRLLQTQGSVTGDWSLDPVTSTLTLVSAPVLGTLVLIDVLAPASSLPPARVTTQQLLDFDVDPSTGTAGQIDGTRTTFPLALMVPPHDPITVARAVDLLVFIDGVTQKPGNDYNVTGTNITFGEPPTPGGGAWALWFAPDLSGLARDTAAPQLAARLAPGREDLDASCVCPVGTVLTSLLPPQRFQGQPGTENWLPCDGRDISGTRLADMLGTGLMPVIEPKGQLWHYARVD